MNEGDFWMLSSFAIFAAVFTGVVILVGILEHRVYNRFFEELQEIGKQERKKAMERLANDE